MRAYEFDTSIIAIDEANTFLGKNGIVPTKLKAGASALGNTMVSIKNSFASKIKALLDKNERARLAGEAEIRKFTNDHMTTFNKLMGRYRQNWNSVTMYVIYRYLNKTMRLNDNEIMQIVNNVMRESGQSLINSKTLKDSENNIQVNTISKNAQITAEKIIANAAIKQLEKHWDNEDNTDSNSTTDSNLAKKQQATASSDTIETPLIKKAKDGFTYRLDVSSLNAVWLRTDGSGEASDNIARELSMAAGIAEHNIFDKNLYDILETSTGGATASGSIASVANPIGTTISRTPNLFGYIPANSVKSNTKVRKRRNKRKNVN